MLKHVERFIEWSEKRLKERGKEELNLYFTELGRIAQFQDWQMIQAVRAIRVVYEEMIIVDWAKD